MRQICWGRMGRTTIAFFIFTFILATTSVLVAAVIGSRSIQDVRVGDGRLPRDGIVIPPRLVRHSAPEYTEAARTRQVQGSVKVQAEFDIHGGFRVIRILEGLGFGLDENALIALSNWRFIPAYRHGMRVSVIAEIDIPFKLDADLYSRAVKEFDRNGVEDGRLLLQRLINTYQSSDYLPAAKYQLAVSFYNEGTPSALNQAAGEFRQFLTFFPSSPLSGSAKQQLERVQEMIGTIK
jgi:TonB family protein